ncbi:6-carboxytetrahydropterin synthase QueD [Eubacterium oxidoreducens]|uniref:6-carboxy-5,6,7,8-tetrahydropterin synthase n=1 Tax=Eubacterium oxidoreducens TaxID=1732 RepID=A0A1G6A6D2_EUBOX|nr:6-carboxytetrahydropterin synthase QueD [Eubacterium oxidoreducens]SDB03593.1 6-pyruvoyltetrahydropterin/6-carboxytetrahydropterin synthase [Eubacterium oxidoreducens]
MYFLKTEQSFDAAHFLSGYDGKCKNLHGHRWRVVAQISGECLNDDTQTRGMLVDFGELKSELKKLCDDFDHSFIYEKGSLKEKTVVALREEDFRMVEVDFRPTAECFAKYFFDKMKERGYAPHRIEVYETVNNCAAYEES